MRKRGIAVTMVAMVVFVGDSDRRRQLLLVMTSWCLMMRMVAIVTFSTFHKIQEKSKVGQPKGQVIKGHVGQFRFGSIGPCWFWVIALMWVWIFLQFGPKLFWAIRSPELAQCTGHVQSGLCQVWSQKVLWLVFYTGPSFGLSDWAHCVL